MINYLRILIGTFCLTFYNCFGVSEKASAHYYSVQSRTIDSLETALEKAKEDTSKVTVFNNLSLALIETSPNTAKKCCLQALNLIKKLGVNSNGKAYREWLKFASSEAYSTLGKLSFSVTQDKKSALEFHLQAMQIREKLIKSTDKAIAWKCKKGLGDTYKNIGAVYQTADYDKSIEYFIKALPYLNQTNDKLGMALINSNIGSFYTTKGEYEIALHYLSDGLSIAYKTKDQPTIAFAFLSFGNFYSAKGDNGKTSSEANLNYAAGLNYYDKAINIAEKSKNKTLVICGLSAIVDIYKKQNKYDDAITYLFKKLDFAKELNSKIYEAEAYNTLSAIYILKHDYKKGYDFSQLYSKINDSIVKKQLSARVADVQVKFEKEKKEKERELLTKIKESESKAELNKQKLVRNSFIFGFVFLLLFLIVIVNRFLLIRKQKEIIELQKQMVIEKNKEITSSINYALRIQTAILPPHKIVRQSLNNSFIVYKPKDIVAGDFYWMENVELRKEKNREIETGKIEQHNSPFLQSNTSLILFAACDCTGHGVPGAMVSVVCHNALNRAVHEFGLTKPSAILDKTAELVVENFAKSEDEIKDGMDISLCAYNIQTKTIQWAGANNPLWIIRANHSETNSEYIPVIEEIKANKQSIGNNLAIQPFTNHEFVLQTGDAIYIFSDGFADQFGGENEKKLTRKGFREQLLSIQDKTMQEQGEFLDQFIIHYRGLLEQTDDILVMGVKM